MQKTSEPLSHLSQTIPPISIKGAKETLHPLKDYFAIGFDVDHCLARNRVKELFPTLCNSLYKVLIEERSYPQTFYEHNAFEKNFFMNGLVIDLENANILKLGEGKRVLRAYFGYRRLTQEELEKAYGSPPTFEKFDPKETQTDDYACYLTFFDCYYPLVFAKMVEFKRNGRDYLEKDQIKQIMDDTMYAVDVNYSNCDDEKYTPIEKVGHYYREILNNQGKYLYKHEEMLGALKALKAQGKILFLISDSHYEYVNALMEHGYGDDWKDLFDYFLLYAKKTKFFYSDKKFTEVDLSKENKMGPEVEVLKKKQLYIGGNATLLEKNLRNAAGNPHGRILYVGDHYSHDVLAAKSLEGWDAICVLEELGKLDLGDEFDGRVWGPWDHEKTPYGVIPTFWYSEMMKKADKCTNVIDSKEMLEFFHQEDKR